MIGKIRQKLISLEPRPILKGQEVFCPICERLIPESQKDAHHLVPKSKGGKTTNTFIVSATVKSMLYLLRLSWPTI